MNAYSKPAEKAGSVRNAGNRLLARASLFTAAAALLAAAIGNPVRAQNTIKLGVIGDEDSPTFRGVSLAVDEANQVEGATVQYEVLTAPATTAEEVSTALDDLNEAEVLAIFGPDDDALAIAGLSSLATAGVPVFSGATDTTFRPGGFVFRTRADDNVRMTALANVLLNDLAPANDADPAIAIYQGGSAYASQATAFVTALARLQIEPLTTVLPVENSPLESSVDLLLEAPPTAIVAFGTQTEVSDLFKALAARNFTGTLGSVYGSNPAFVRGLPAARRANIVGVTGWSVSSRRAISTQFGQNFISAFGEAPDTLAAGAYDAANAVISAVSRSNADEGSALLAAIKSGAPVESVQGATNPRVGNGLLTNSVAVTVTGANGTVRTLIRFDGANRVDDTSPTTIATAPAGGGAPTLIVPPTLAVAPTVAVPPTLVIPPTVFVPPTAVPPPILVTATPNGVVLTVITDFVNVRTGPSTAYTILGQLRRDQQVQLFGINAERTWYVINFQGGQAWVTGDRSLVSVFGNPATLPVVQAPPSPIPPATQTPLTPTLPAAAAFPDIQLVAAAISPNPIRNGVPSVIVVTVRNAGPIASGQFAVAASLKPGEVYGFNIVPPLAPGASATINLNYPGVTVTTATTETIAIVLDLNNEVPEGDVGEANNKPTLTYLTQP